MHSSKNVFYCTCLLLFAHLCVWAAPYSAYLQGGYAQLRGDYSQAHQAFSQVDDGAIPLERKFNLALSAGEIKTAANIAKRMLTVNNEASLGAIVYLVLGVQAAHEKDWVSADKYFATAQEESPEVVYFQLLRNFVAKEANKPLDDIIKLHESQDVHLMFLSQHQYHLGRLLAMKGDNSAARKALLTAYGLDNGTLLATAALGDMYMQLEEWQNARNIYASFMAHNPGVLLFNNALAEAVEQEYVSSARYTAPTFDQLGGEVVFNFAMMIWAQGLDVPARQLLNLALWMDADQSFYQYYAGLMDETEGLSQQALARYSNVQPSAPAWLAMQVRVIDIYRAEGNFTEATALAEKLMKKYPQHSLMQQLLAEIYYENQNFKEALPHFDALIADIETPSVRHAAWYFARGASYERLKQYKDAEYDLQQALALDPHNAKIMNYLGYMWVEQDIHIDKALGLLNKALELAPTDAAILDSLGWAYFKNKQPKKAAQYIRKAYNLDASDPIITEHMGDIYAEQGNTAQAREFWQRAADMLRGDAESLKRINKKLNKGKSLFGWK